MLDTNLKVHLYYTMDFFKTANQLYKSKRKWEMLKRSFAAMIEPKGKWKGIKFPGWAAKDVCIYNIIHYINQSRHGYIKHFWDVISVWDLRLR